MSELDCAEAMTERVASKQRAVRIVLDHEESFPNGDRRTIAEGFRFILEMRARARPRSRGCWETPMSSDLG
jgi:hypothetical protein